MKVFMAAWNIEFAFVLQALWKGKKYRDEMELWQSWESSVCCGRAREVCSQYIAKVMFAGWGNKRWSHREFVFLFCFGEKRECLQKILTRGEVVARCRSEIRHRSRHNQFWGWRKGVPVCGVLNVSNPYSTGNPWSKKNNQGVHELGCFSHGALLPLLLENRR